MIQIVTKMVMFYIEFVYDLLTTGFFTRLHRGALKVRMTLPINTKSKQPVLMNVT